MAEFVSPPDLFRVDGENVHLLASTSSTSQYLVFPAEPDRSVIELSSEGTLYTWTSQEFPPPSPPALKDGEFRSYGVGYVEFPEGLLVEGRLTSCDPSELPIGGRMKVVTIPFAGGETFAFEPIKADESDRGQ
ncbi:MULTISPECIES: Zn-ribbon domain-containing OB-fold protein [Rhodococcus]|uniref:OB-fold domain-containing protein n=1 Tax=Rhodococcus oxybenzonivorans TaxID=1990687 RepID=A0AAE4UYK0_9NOCA|nr:MULTISPECIES: OB-fold domain-containing protein [Rhodococcus]MDV7241891.1 OB-fold domain-containing protein [Rhodococcus oxybenzonivorans]MDV7265455.1 OB-fold domain-containing protein [Rhodococcus oxybenzonivorans]MDV7273575.1 OB-fold domain-containing protein [Rhodococcus oxybenzonivorans]MDV7334173.1 OB-fold domain-containing protein [Rhodococcus oxybenzonivorans]MDV7343592.1 OB-fold domain-containing protein [Rhodococcus oxybenzonivorans]